MSGPSVRWSCDTSLPFLGCLFRVLMSLGAKRPSWWCRWAVSSHVEVLQLWPCERCMQIEFRDPFLEDMEPEQLLAVWDEARVASNSRVFAHGSAALPGADAARRRPRSGPTGGPADGPRSPLGESRRQSALAARLSLLTVSCGGSSLKKPRAAAGPADRVLALLQGAHSVLLALVSRIAITIHGCLARTRLLYTACIRL